MIRSLAVTVLCFSFSLDELEGFVQATVEGLEQPVAPGNHEGLVEVMRHLLAIRNRQAATDKMFEPLRDITALLEQYGVTIPEQVYCQLEVRVIVSALWSFFIGESVLFSVMSVFIDCLLIDLEMIDCAADKQHFLRIIKVSFDLSINNDTYKLITVNSKLFVA